MGKTRFNLRESIGGKINTQTYCLTGGAYYPSDSMQSDPNGVAAKAALYKAYEAIHKYENFHGDTNRRSELNDRLDQVKEWMISQWPDIRTGSYGVSGFSGFSTSLPGGMSVRYTPPYQSNAYKPPKKSLVKAIKKVGKDLGFCK